MAHQPVDDRTRKNESATPIANTSRADDAARTSEMPMKRL